MKALLLLSVLLSGVLAITAAAVEAPEAVKAVEAPEAPEAPEEVVEAVETAEAPEAPEAPEEVVEAVETAEAPEAPEEVVEAVETVEAVEAPEEVVKAVETVEAVEAPEVVEAVKAALQKLQKKKQSRFFLCPAGWIRYKNSCYRFVSSTGSWSGAASYCASLGATLASAHDVFEYNFLQQLTSRAGASVSWMGGFYFQGWRWVDQSSFNYNYWSAHNSVSRYPCIYLRTAGGWSNSVCSTGRPFTCMKRTDTC